MKKTTSTAAKTTTVAASFRKDLDNALHELEAKHGLHISRGRMVKDTKGVHMNLNLTSVPVKPAANAAPAANEEQEVSKTNYFYRTLFKHSHFALEHADWLGKQIYYKGALYSIIGASSNRSNGRIAVRLRDTIRFLKPEKIQVCLDKANKMRH